MKKNKSVLFIAVLLFACSTVQTNNNETVNQDLTSQVNAESESILGILKEFNLKAPVRGSAVIQVDAVINKKKFKSSGTAVFDKETDRINVVLQDYVFKSPIFNFFQEGAKLYIYNPAEKELIIDNTEKADLGSYTELDIDYLILRSFGYGEIPFIKNYKIKQTINNLEQKEYIIILENDQFFQTIFLKDKQPSKMLFTNKKNKERIEVYLNKIYSDTTSVFFQKIRIVSVDKKITIDLTFSKISLNKPVIIKSFSSLKLSNDVKKTILNN